MLCNSGYGRGRSYIRIARDILFPPLCVVCATHLSHDAETVCGACLAHIALLRWRLCPQCGARTVTEVPTCHPKVLYTLIAAASYASPETQALVKALKYDGIRTAASTLALLTAAAARDTLERELLTPASPAGPPAGRTGRREPWMLVPVPLHPRRERERGFNQSALFAEALTRHRPFAGIPLIHALRRTRNTETQTERPDSKARRTNVAGCFAASDPPLVRGKNILLIDDVTTSGATLDEAARALKSAGAKHVVALVFAKA